MDIVINTCLEDFYDTSNPSNVKTYSFVDFESLVLDIQLASLYPYSTAR